MLICTFWLFVQKLFKFENFGQKNFVLLEILIIQETALCFFKEPNVKVFLKNVFMVELFWKNFPAFSKIYNFIFSIIIFIVSSDCV